MKVGMLTGGGDCPGLNAVIRAVTKRGYQFGFEMWGIRGGWKGLLEKDWYKLEEPHVSGILHRGGTMLGTSRTNPHKAEDTAKLGLANFNEAGFDALVAIGGEDTLGAAKKYHDMGMNVVGVPKTIDNDLSGTDWTFGFYTAVSIVSEAIDRLYTTAASHHRVIVLEVMGRHAGWIATIGGLAGGADYICIPEREIQMEDLNKALKHRKERGKEFSIVVVAEGAKIAGADITKGAEKDQFGHVLLGGIGERLAKAVEDQTGFETRHTVLGHVQRGGSPVAFDRVLSLRYGVKAAEMVHEKEFGKMAALRGSEVVAIPLSEAVASLKTVDDYWYDLASIFFG